MVELIGGIIVGGVAGVALKDKLMGTNPQNDAKQKEVDSLYAENEKYGKRNKELERQVEDLLSEGFIFRNAGYRKSDAWKLSWSFKKLG